MTNKNLFISYAWNDNKDKKIIDKIDEAFKSIGITLTRDIRSLEYCGNIKDFMKTIREADYVLMIISNSYLTSKNCMYEVLEFVKDENFKNKILPVFLDDCKDIFNNKGQIEYINFWQKELKNNKKHLKGIDPLKALKQHKELREIENISNDIGEFLSTISSMNLISLQNLQEQNYQPILNRIGFDATSIESELLKIHAIDDIEEQDLALEELQNDIGEHYLLLYSKAFIEIERKHYKKAIYYFEYSIMLEPDIAEPHLALAFLLTNHFEKHEQAKKHLLTAIKLNDNFADAHYALAILLANYFRDEEQAKKYYDKAIKLKPELANKST